MNHYDPDELEEIIRKAVKEGIHSALWEIFLAIIIGGIVFYILERIFG